VDCGVDCVGFEARGHGADAKHEAPATVLNSLMTVTRAAGALGIPGLYVTQDPGAVDDNAKFGNLSIRIGLGWAKSHRFTTGQCPVMRYNRQLMMAILYDKIQIAKAVKLYNKKNKEKIHFYIVGEIKENKIWKSIKRLKENISATGYVELSEFKTYMGASDIIINLRFPTQGESSGSLHRAFGMGKPVIVTNTGTFSEYPNGVVLKVSHDSNEVNDIYEAISKLVQDTKLREEYGRNAFEFARENCSLKNNAVKYRDFIFDLFNGNLQEKDNIENLTDNLFYLGLTDEEYIKSLCNKLDIGIRWE
jgi:hypothetical protein